MKTLDQIVRPEGTFVPGIIGILQFEGAGAAKEPVTTDCVDLMMGKQRRQRQLFLGELKHNKDMCNSLEGDRLLFASNDVNTNIVGVPLTKSPLQKEAKLGQVQYKKLIVASLKYLAMKHAGHKVPFTWEEMQKSWSVIEDCLKVPWKDHVFLPIDYQAVDAFELDRLSVCRSKLPKLETLNPKVVVINQAYGGIQLDFTKGNNLVDEIVGNYLKEHWTDSDFTPDRYPLGIKQKDLLAEFLRHNQHVTFSDHQTERVVYLRDQLDTDRRREVTFTLERIEHMLNGYNSASMSAAEPYLTGRERRDMVVVINRKPGFPDIITQRRV